MGKCEGQCNSPLPRSVEPIVSIEQAITRMAVTTEKESEAQQGGNRTMGRKEIVPYGLYAAHGFVSPFLAAQTGFSDADLTLLWDALKGMFEQDHSSARGEMSSRKLVVFEHERALGNAPAHLLFERVKVSRKDETRPARAYSDYKVDFHRNNLPQGITAHELL